MIIDRAIDIISVLQPEKVGWEGDGLISVQSDEIGLIICVLHISYHIQQKVPKFWAEITID